MEDEKNKDVKGKRVKWEWRREHASIKKIERSERENRYSRPKHSIPRTRESMVVKVRLSDDVKHFLSDRACGAL